MAEEFQLGRGNWWESSTSSSTTTSSSRNKFIESGISSCTTPSASGITLGSMASNFVWPTEIEDIKARSDNRSMVFPADSQRSYTTESSVSGGGGGGGRDVLSVDPNLQMMGLGLSPQGLDWNHPFFRGEKSGSGFRSILQEGLSSNANYQQEGTCHEQDHNWSTTQKIYHGNSDDSSVNDYNKQMMNRGISLDHQSQVFSGHNLENSAPYGSPSNMLQGLLISDNTQQQESNHFTSASRSLYYNPSYNNQSNCDVNIPPTSVDAMPTSSSSSSSWSKFPQFLRTSDPPKQQWPLPQPPPPHGQSSHFPGGTPFWNATSAATNDVRSSFVPSLHPHLANPMVDEKPKHAAEVRNISTIAKKANSTETSNKRPRNEAPSPLPAFKVRKEKMGDRITALQQLVSPFGKTDTASVLSEAIEYIKFLHEQVNVLSTPYMKSGASMQHQQQSGDKSNVNPGGGKQDLRSRGLCLVPVSSTFPVTHETTVDFWTPTFGGTFR